MKRINVERCRSFRRDQTDAERKLWGALRGRNLCGLKFRRQFAVGKYILDSYSPEYGLGIEVDGGYHYEDKGREYDEQRTLELDEAGIRILRFSNTDVLQNIEGVCEVIYFEIKKTPSPQSSPPRGEEV